MPAVARKAPTPELARIVDELGLLEKEYALAIAPFEKKLPRIKALKEILQAACPPPVDKEWIVEGSRFGVRLGPRAVVKSIDLARLLNLVGLVKFRKFVSTVFAKYPSCGVSSLPDPLAGGVVTEEQTGPRRLSIYEKGVA